MPTIRPRRLRKSPLLRDLVAEVDLLPRNLVYPLFVKDVKSAREPIKTLPGIDRLGEKELLATVATALELGVGSIALFPVIDNKLKSATADEAHNPKGLVPRTVRLLKSKFPELVIFTDVALDPYSTEGHDGLVRNGEILNDESLEVLAKQAVAQAQAGADFVSPSDMMDGRVAYIRRALDGQGFTKTGILSYAIKYASAFYGPFREALDSAPKFGDKKTYQMDFRNRREALREVKLDVREGADIVMVKPALSYLDVIHDIRSKVEVPVAAYSVSGEYAMLKFGALSGAFDEKSIVFETHLAMRRAGADFIFTYFALDLARQLKR